MPGGATGTTETPSDRLSSAAASLVGPMPARQLTQDEYFGKVVESQKAGLEVMAVGDALQPRPLAERPRGDIILTPRFALYDSGGSFDIWRAAGDGVAQSLGRGLPMDAYALHDGAADG